MTDFKTIAVVGATGAQGSGLVEAILGDPSGEFRVRALTRNPDSEPGRKLASRGVEVVEADLDRPETIRRAFEGAYGAFCVTFFWDHFSPEKELEHAGVMAEAARDTGLKHVIWSTLEDTRRWVPLEDDRMPTLLGKYKVPHFDAKGEANAEFSGRGVPTTFLLTSFYWENFIYFGSGPKPAEDGRLVLTLPMGDRRLPGIAVEDIGGCALGIFSQGEEMVGRTVGIAGEHLTGSQMAEAMSRALGRSVTYSPVSFDVFRGLGFPGADDLGNMYQFKHDFQEYFCGARDVAFSRALNPGLQTFDRWLSRNASRIPLE